uniref:Uncharacterized protein n=1 Tax=Anguilla anguilla TaxID=7936 RepID=A0A0E9Q832_ANGAN
MLLMCSVSVISLPQQCGKIVRMFCVIAYDFIYSQGLQV